MAARIVCRVLGHVCAVAVVVILTARPGVGAECESDASAAHPSGAPARRASVGTLLLSTIIQDEKRMMASVFADAPTPPTPAQTSVKLAARKNLFHYYRPGPVFPPALFPALNTMLLPHWQQIRDEALHVKHDMNLFRKYQDFADTTSVDILERMLEQGNDGWITVGWAKDRDWQNFGLVYGGRALPGGPGTLCPQTVALLESIPGIRLAGLSKLTPSAHIPTHTDYTGLKQRSLSVHLYLTGYAQMRVGDRWVEHVPGNLFVFDSNSPHEVYNSDAERILLYLDLDVDLFFWKTEGLDLRGQARAEADA